MGWREHLADTRPLQQPDFRRLWNANIITVIGAQLTVVAVPSQIYEITKSSAYVGLTGMFGLVPLVVLGLYGGALADAMDRRKLLMITTLGLIVMSALFWAQAATHVRNVWVILVIFAIQQAFFAVNQPTRSALLPRIVPLEQLPAANSLNMTVTQFGAIAGPLVGGALIPVLGYSWLYLLDTLSMLATLRAVIKLPPMPPIGAVTRAGMRSVLDGLGYLRGNTVLLMSFVVDIIAMTFGMPRALFPQLAHVSFGGPIGGGLAFALLFAAIPAGAVLGGIFSGWVSRASRQGLSVIVAIVIWGVGITVSGLAASFADGAIGIWLWLCLVGLMVAGAADMASAAFRSTMLQEAADDDVRGRLQGVFIVVVAGGPRIADTLHGGVAALVGAPATAAGGGILVIIGVLIASAAAPAFIRYRVNR